VACGAQHIGETVAGEIDEAQVGIAPVDRRQLGEAFERFEILLNGAAVEARLRLGERH
jgi:hypothetical protein